MGAGAVRQPPYPAVRWLTRWAVENDGYLRGRMILAGRAETEMDLADWLDVAHAACVEGGDLVMRDAFADFLDGLDHPASAPPFQAPALATPKPRAAAGSKWNAETWGTDPAAQAALASVTDRSRPAGGGERR